MVESEWNNCITLEHNTAIITTRHLHLLRKKWTELSVKVKSNYRQLQDTCMFWGIECQLSEASSFQKYTSYGWMHLHNDKNNAINLNFIDLKTWSCDDKFHDCVHDECLTVCLQVCWLSDFLARKNLGHVKEMSLTDAKSTAWIRFASNLPLSNSCAANCGLEIFVITWVPLFWICDWNQQIDSTCTYSTLYILTPKVKHLIYHFYRLILFRQ